MACRCYPDEKVRRTIELRETIPFWGLTAELLNHQSETVGNESFWPNSVILTKKYDVPYNYASALRKPALEAM